MRKSKYDTHVAPFLKEISQMARNGATDEEIAGKLEVAYSTFRIYKREHAELDDALAATKELADLNVEAALYKRAVGYDYEEISDKYDGEDLIEHKVTKKHVVADATAQKFWLMNRNPEKWKDKQIVEHAGLEEQQAKFAELLEQRRKRREEK